MRPMDMNEVEQRRQEILDTLRDPTTTHEQKVTYLARHAENFMKVLDEPTELDELMRCPIETRCICNLFEGEAPYRPRYITPDYEKFLREGSAFLQLEPPKDLFEALNSLMTTCRASRIIPCTSAIWTRCWSRSRRTWTTRR